MSNDSCGSRRRGVLCLVFCLLSAPLVFSQDTAPDYNTY